MLCTERNQQSFAYPNQRTGVHTNLLTNYVMQAGQPALPAYDGEVWISLPIATSWAYFGPREML